MPANTSASFICEPLESRQLFAAAPALDIYFDRDGSGSIDTKKELIPPSETPPVFDVGTTTAADLKLSNVVEIRNAGSVPVEFQIVQYRDGLGNHLLELYRENGTPLNADFDHISTIRLNHQGDAFRFRIGATPGSTGDQVGFVDVSFDNPNDPKDLQLQRTLNLRYQVINSTSTTDVWNITPGTPNGLTAYIQAYRRSDLSGASLVYITDRLISFDLPQLPNTFTYSGDLTLTGRLRSNTSFGNIEYALPSAVLVRDTHNFGKLDADELAASQQSRLQPKPPTTGSINGIDLKAGKYLIYLTAVVEPGTTIYGSANELQMDVTVGLNVRKIGLPQVIVYRDTPAHGIGLNDSPSGNAYTSFGSIVEASAAPTLTFTVKDSGGTTLHIGGQGPDLDGSDFQIVELLSSSIGVGQTDTFTVKLGDTSVGTKSGKITIKSDAVLSEFVFYIGGEVTPAPVSDIQVRGAMSFGTITQGDPAPVLSFTVTNNGDADLIIDAAPTITGPFVIVDRLAGRIAKGGGSDVFAVQLKDSSTAGNVSGTVKITSNAASGPVTLQLSGKIEANTTQLPPPPPPPPAKVAFVTRTGNNLTVAGTSGNDKIGIKSAGDVLTITRNGVANSTRFSVAQIKQITVNCSDGDDVVVTTAALKINQILNGGAGMDDLRGGAGADQLNGGTGNDRLDGGAGKNTLSGGKGKDTLLARNGVKDVIKGGDGRDNVAGDLLDRISGVETKDLR